MLPEGTFLFAPEARDEDGYYIIMPGQTYVFPFQVPFLGQIDIGIVHANTFSQDWSLVAWYSDGPLDYNVFPRSDDWENVNVGRVVRTMTIYDTMLMEPNDTRMSLPSNRLHHINIQNRQNARNSFKLTFSN